MPRIGGGGSHAHPPVVSCFFCIFFLFGPQASSLRLINSVIIIIIVIKRVKRVRLSGRSLVVGAGARGGLKSVRDGPGGGAEGEDEGWSFIEATDQEFIDAHPQLVKGEAERWQAIAPW